MNWILSAFFMLKEHQVYPTYFDTSSCAEHHWPQLHNLLTKYITKITLLQLSSPGHLTKPTY